MLEFSFCFVQNRRTHEPTAVLFCLGITTGPPCGSAYCPLRCYAHAFVVRQKRFQIEFVVFSRTKTSIFKIWAMSLLGATLSQEELSNNAFSCCVLLKYERHSDKTKKNLLLGKSRSWPKMAKNHDTTLLILLLLTLHSCWLLLVPIASITFRGPPFMLWALYVSK